MQFFTVGWAADGKRGDKTWLRLGSALLLVLLVAGCETPAQRLEPATVKVIQPGLTTKADVLKIYGTPRQSIVGDGRTLLVWDVVYWARPDSTPFSPSDSTLARMLSVLFDENGIVLKSLLSEHRIPTTFSAGVVFIGRDFDAKVLAQIKVGATTLPAARTLLGEPAFESFDLNGNPVIDWAYSTGDYIAGETQLRLLRLFIGSAGKVAAVRQVNYP